MKGERKLHFFNIPAPMLPKTRCELLWLIGNGKHLGWKRSLSKVVADLGKPLPSDLLTWFKHNGYNVPYIKSSDASLILDYVAPGWQLEITYIGDLADRVACKATLTLLCAEGQFSRSAMGSKDLRSSNGSDLWQELEECAFRRACACFGLGRYLEDNDIVRALILQKTGHQSAFERD